MVTFTIDEIMDALDEAHAETHPRTSQDCAVELRFKQILSARTELVGSCSTKSMAGLSKHKPKPVRADSTL